MTNYFEEYEKNGSFFFPGFLGIVFVHVNVVENPPIEFYSDYLFNYYF